MIAVLLRIQIFLILATNLGSCIASPGFSQVRPAVTGNVLEEKQVIAEMELFLAKNPGTNEPCLEKGETIQLSEDGSFSWNAVQQEKLTDSFINPSAMRSRITVLCIKHPKKGIVIGAMLFVKEKQAATLRLICNLGHPRERSELGANMTSTPLGQAQYCKATTIE